MSRRTVKNSSDPLSLHRMGLLLFQRHMLFQYSFECLCKTESKYKETLCVMKTIFTPKLFSKLAEHYKFVSYTIIKRLVWHSGALTDTRNLPYHL